MKEATDKFNFIKIKNALQKTINVKTKQSHASDLEKYSEKTHLIRRSYPKYTKNS